MSFVIYSYIQSKRVYTPLACVYVADHHCKATVLDSLVIHMSMDKTFNQLVIRRVLLSLKENLLTVDIVSYFLNQLIYTHFSLSTTR